MVDNVTKLNIIAARSGMGKTTLIEKLLPELIAKGLRVAALKGNSNRCDFDIPGKDTWRYLEAGARISGIITPDKYILMGTAADRTRAMEYASAMLKDIDLLLIEGNKRSNNPKIEVIRTALGTEPSDANNVIAIATDLEESDTDIPVFDLNNPGELADFIFNRFFVRNDEGVLLDAEKHSLTHFDLSGRPRMVDVTAKATTLREAYAKGEITMAPATLERVKAGTVEKGDVLGVAQVAAVMAVKETGRLIPMSHPLVISGVDVDFDFPEKENKIEIGVRVKINGQTGVEMEALTGVTVAALTIYDMCKAIDKEMTIQNIRLEEKKGGRSGFYRRKK
ncbi:MAG: cyclic pyranopterin monophosphate synthase MoaC [Dethiobacteria bacterium]